MPLRIYTVNQKYVKNKNGDIGVYKKKIKKWIKSKKPYKPQKRGLEKLSIYSTRFGFLDLYNRKEQQMLICPSGHSISQCFNVLRKLWYAYRRAIGTDNDIAKMKKYAKAIQDVQKDMGIKTASFPYLRLYGDVFVLNDKNGKRIHFENHSALKKKQERYEKWKKEQADQSTEIQKHLQKPDKDKGEKLETIVDDVSPADVVRAYAVEEELPVPDLLEPDEAKGESILTRTDDIPFFKNFKKTSKNKSESILTIADDLAPNEKPEAHVLSLVPHTLNPEEDEEILVISDDTSES